MELTKENLQEWKAELSRIAKPYFGNDFAECISDEDWLADSLGETTEYILNENLRGD